MRTNIVLNEELVQAAFQYANVSTKRELIDLALKEFVMHRQRLNLSDLLGTVKLRKDYDYKKLRNAE